MVRLGALLVGIALAQIHGTQGAAEYFGRYIGPLSRLLHSVSGEVYAVDARTLHIKDFTYDGEAPAAYFYAGSTKAVGPGGFFLRDENGSNGELKKYHKKQITVTLPEGKTLHNIKWLSIWCEEFQVNFGDIEIPRGLDFPKPQKIGSLSGVHAVSSDNIVVVDAQTLLIPSFSYDGEAPDAKFWVGRGPKPSPQGIRVPDENGKTVPLRRYDRKTIVLTLPGELTIFDIGHFGVWCEAFTVDFGHVQIPPALNVPPSLKMLGVSPQKRSPALQQYLSQQESSKQYQSQQDPQPSSDVSYESLLSLFNTQEIIRPTTFRPPLHRFGAPQARSLFGSTQKQGVQVQSSVSLTPEPIVFTQIGNQPLQRVYNSQAMSAQDYTQQDEQQANKYVQNQQLQQNVLLPQVYALQDQQKLHRPSQVQDVPGFLLQPSLNFVQQPVNLPPQVQQEPKAIQPPSQYLQIQPEPNAIQPPSQYLQIPNAFVPQFTYNTISEGLTPPLFYQRPPVAAEASAIFLQQQQAPVQCLPPACNVPREARQYLPKPNPPLQDLPNPYHELAARRSYVQQQQQQQQLQQAQRRQYTF